MNDGFGVKSGMDSSNISSIMKNGGNQINEVENMPKHYQIVGYDSQSVRVPPVKYNTGVKNKRASNQYSADR